MRRVLVAMSGGVDSSVAAALLVRQGHDVLGVTMQLWGKDVCVESGTRLCCSVRDSLDAKAVARALGIEHRVVDFAETFRTEVIDYFVQGYRHGTTPNPCIACNDHLKFGSLLDYATAQGCEFVASGHYARLTREPDTGRWMLRRAVAIEKDQSYVLFNLTQAQLARVQWPLGELSKPAVREVAREMGLATAEKPDSQDVCFVRDHNKDGFLQRELQVGEDPGDIVDVGGRTLGTHHGLLGYTVGQREGLGIAVGVPLYVVEVDQPRNRLVVGPREALLKRTLLAERVNWVSIPAPTRPIRAWAKIRSRHEAAAALIHPVEAAAARVEFDEPQAAITPGQAVVFYDGEVVLGGGWITTVAK